MSSHILYSFRRCPYAIRARMTLRVAGIEYEHREVLLKDKPAELVRVSPKATVPVLILNNSEQTQVLEESIDIMRWALAQQDPELWLAPDSKTQQDIENWLATFEENFKPNLDAYKYGNDKSEEAADSKTTARKRCETVLAELDTRLTSNRNAGRNAGTVYLFGKQLGFADVAVFPFIRQYAAVEPERFRALQLSALNSWLDRWLEDPRFLEVMQKHPRWEGAD